MAEASLDLQKAIRGRLAADAGLNAIVAGRIHDTAALPTTFPSVTLGEDQVAGNFAGEYDGSEVFLTLHVWSRDVGLSEAKRIVGALRSSLHNAPLSADDHRIAVLAFENARFLRDPDGKTHHGVATFRALVEPEA